MAEKTLEEMRQAVAEIREKMAAAAREAGRDPAAVQLCAACKTRTAQTIAASAALPIDVFGENHVQELCANYDAGAYCGKPSLFIGGKVWRILNEKGEQSMFTLCHELGLTFEDVAIAIGWLARENKILLRKKEGMLYASIENVEFTFG